MHVRLGVKETGKENRGALSRLLKYISDRYAMYRTAGITPYDPHAAYVNKTGWKVYARRIPRIFS